MSHHYIKSDDPKVQAHIARLERRDRTVEHLFRRCLHLLEQTIAGITLIVLIASLGMELVHMFKNPESFSDVTHFLHNILTIVIGLEFVRMLIDTTPANILEVLTLAITRHVILEHADPWSNLACVACIAGLFAVRRFLIRRSELKEEMVDIE
jgi:phosphate starvation-inducible membrane PsiE